MKLSELNAKAQALKEAIVPLHAELKDILSSDTMVVSKALEAEKAVRAKIVELNDALFPMEMERSEIDRMVKGKPRKQEESYLSEAVTLG